MDTETRMVARSIIRRLAGIPGGDMSDERLYTEFGLFLKNPKNDKWIEKLTDAEDLAICTWLREVHKS